MNRLVKTAIDGLGANKSKNAILRVGKAIGSLATVTQSVDRGIGMNQVEGTQKRVWLKT